MRPDPLRHLAAAIALLWLVVPVANVLHGTFSSHAHRYCGEHEVVEEDPTGPAPGRESATTEQAGPLLYAAGAAGVDEGL